MYGKNVVLALAASLASGVSDALGRFNPLSRVSAQPLYRGPTHSKRYRSKAPLPFGGNPAGSKLARKIGQLTCRHSVGTHHKLQDR